MADSSTKAKTFGHKMEGKAPWKRPVESRMSDRSSVHESAPCFSSVLVHTFLNAL